MKKYKVNEIFYSIQGEGYNTGRAAIFIRLSGCNLKCPFCDTDFGSYKEMTADEIVDEVVGLSDKVRFAVITGGEPTLQDCSLLISKLHMKAISVAMESNGTKKAPDNLDWLTISPKSPFVGDAGNPKVSRCDELKLVFDGEHEPSEYNTIFALHYYLQPCDTGDAEKNREIIKKCVEYIKENPKWKMSLQTQKILNVR